MVSEGILKGFKVLFGVCPRPGSGDPHGGLPGDWRLPMGDLRCGAGGLRLRRGCERLLQLFAHGGRGLFRVQEPEEAREPGRGAQHGGLGE